MERVRFFFSSELEMERGFQGRVNVLRSTTNSKSLHVEIPFYYDVQRVVRSLIRVIFGSLCSVTP